MQDATSMTGVLGFADVAVREEDEQVFISYRSGLSVYTEVFADGALSSLGWHGAGFVGPLHWLPSRLDQAEGRSFAIEAAGEALISGWTLEGVDVEESETGRRATIRLRHTGRKVGVQVVTEIDGSGILARRLVVANLGETASPLGHVTVWGGMLWAAPTGEGPARSAVAPPRIDVGFMQETMWGREGSFSWESLSDAGIVLAGRRQRLPHRHPLFALRLSTTGEVLLGQLAWSGGYEFVINYDRHLNDNSGGAKVTFAMSMDGPSPQIVLAPHEVVQTPVAHLGMAVGDLDHVVHAMTRHIRKSVLPRGPERLGLLEAAIGPEIEITEDEVMHQIELGGTIGAEIFFIDANWYSAPHASWAPTVGDWNVGSRFPKGLAPFRQRAHELGMRFGLWMEAERLGPESDAIRDRADLLGRDYQGRSPRGAIDLSRPEGAQWVEDAIARVISDNQLDFFRLDFNQGFVGDGYVNERDGYQENHYWRYYNAVYGLFARLRKRFPDVIFENCASGGARTDLGMLASFDTTWVTDWQLAPRSFDIVNGMSLALPPEFIGRLVGTLGQKAFVTADLDFQLRIGLFGHPNIPMNTLLGVALNEDHLSRILHFVEIYKTFVKPYAADALIYHHTPDLADVHANGWGVLERAASDRSTSVLAAFRVGEATGQVDHVVYPRGIDPARRYRVLYDNESAETVHDGKDLARFGLPVRAGTLSSQLFVLRALD